MSRNTYTATQLASLLLVVGWLAFSGTTAEAVTGTALALAQPAPPVGQEAAPERENDIKCVRQMPRYRPAPETMFKC